jgi:hypothetical protein
LPALARIWDGTVVRSTSTALRPTPTSSFLALPEAASAELAPQLLERGAR